MSEPLDDALDDPLDDLRAAACSNGAPSARNLLVTVFGDVLLPHGPDTAVSVATLAELLRSFGVNERLVRTSLSRLVNDRLLDVRADGRRSYYRVAPESLDLFSQADRRIYHSVPRDWDGSWTIVVIDGTEATAGRRARLRQELAWAGLGVVAPNVMASPVVAPVEAAAAVGRVGGFSNVLVTRAAVIEANGTLDGEQLARRCAPLDDVATGYHEFVRRFERFDPPAIHELDGSEAFKLRVLIVAAFRRLVLADPLLPEALLPDDWIGDRARSLAAATYRRVAATAEEWFVSVADPPIGRPRPGVRDRFAA